MSDFQRGIVKAIKFEIEYPDGSTKQAEIADAGNVRAIAFHEEHLQSPDDTALFCVSAYDWRENPTMLVYTQHRAPASEGGWIVSPTSLCMNAGGVNVCAMRQ
jgi:hypothetical protein